MVLERPAKDLRPLPDDQQPIERGPEHHLRAVGRLNFEAGREFAEQMHRLYDYYNRRLLEANLNKDVEPIREVERLLGDPRTSGPRCSSSRPPRSRCPDEKRGPDRRAPPGRPGGLRGAGEPAPLRAPLCPDGGRPEAGRPADRLGRGPAGRGARLPSRAASPRSSPAAENISRLFEHRAFLTTEQGAPGARKRPGCAP